MNILPKIPRHPLDGSAIKFALGESITAALVESGPYHLLVTTPSDSTTPESLQGRRIMHALPITKEQADDLHRVANGTHRAVKIPAPKATTSAPLEPHEIRKA